MKVTASTDGSKLFETDRGAILVTHHGAGCASHTCIGHLTADLAAIVTADGDGLLTSFDRCRFIVDCFDVRHLDTAFREHMTEWFKTNRQRNIFGHMLVRSKVIELAANVANLLAGTRFVQVYSSILPWQEACQREVAGFRRRPLDWRPPESHRTP